MEAVNFWNKQCQALSFFFSLSFLPSRPPFAPNINHTLGLVGWSQEATRLEKWRNSFIIVWYKNSTIGQFVSQTCAYISGHHKLTKVKRVISYASQGTTLSKGVKVASVIKFAWTKGAINWYSGGWNHNISMVAARVCECSEVEKGTERSASVNKSFTLLNNVWCANSWREYKNAVRRLAPICVSFADIKVMHRLICSRRQQNKSQQQQKEKK